MLEMKSRAIRSSSKDERNIQTVLEHLNVVSDICYLRLLTHFLNVLSFFMSLCKSTDTKDAYTKPDQALSVYDNMLE